MTMVTRSKTRRNKKAFKHSTKRDTRQQVDVSKKQTNKNVAATDNKLARATKMLSRCHRMRRKLESEQKELLQMKQHSFEVSL